MAHDNSTIIRPDEVRGQMGQANARVDRYFYLHDRESNIVWEVDGFLQPKLKPDAPDRWMLVMLCPACHQGLRIDTAKKPIQVTPRGIETGEPIACTYWLDDVDGYTGLCPFRGELEPPKKIEYGEVKTDLGVQRVKIDAWIRRAL